MRKTSAIALLALLLCSCADDGGERNAAGASATDGSGGPPEAGASLDSCRDLQAEAERLFASVEACAANDECTRVDVDARCIGVLQCPIAANADVDIDGFLRRVEELSSATHQGCAAGGCQRVRCGRSSDTARCDETAGRCVFVHLDEDAGALPK